jgi:hypothetical protein
MHDCNPTSELAALAAANIEEVANKNIPRWTGEWSGDVWKAVVHLRSLRDDLNAFVLDCDSGIGVVSQGSPAEKLSYSEAEISEMDYDFLHKNRRQLLGLRPPEYIHEFLRNWNG